MKVKMLTDAPGSPDGVTVNQYAEGVEYDVTADLAAVFVAESLAELVEADDVTYVLDLPPLGSGNPQPLPRPKPKPRRTKRGAGPRENK